MNHKRRITVLVICIATFLTLGMSTGRATAGGIPVYDVTNLAQNLLTAERSLEQINNQLKMLESLGFDASGDIAGILSETNAALNQVEGLAYNAGQIAAQFENSYPEDMTGMSYDELISLKDSILQQTRSAQLHAMQLQASIADSIPQTQNSVEALVARSNSAAGPTAAIQANNQLLATLSMQISQMQSLLMAQTRALNTYIQEQNTRAVTAEEQRNRMFKGIDRIEPRTDGFDPLAY